MTNPRHTVEAAMYFATHNAQVYRAVKALIAEAPNLRSVNKPRFAQLFGGEDQQALLLDLASENGLKWSKIDGPGLTYQLSAGGGPELFVTVPK